MVQAHLEAPKRTAYGCSLFFVYVTSIFNYYVEGFVEESRNFANTIIDDVTERHRFIVGVMA